MKLFLTFFFCSFFYYSNCQTNSIEDFFDAKIGIENLSLNSGLLYINTFLSENTHQYFETNKYTIGTITYDNQNYSNLKLKYDIFKDLLLVNPEGSTENFGIIINDLKLKNFSILNKKFIHSSLILNDSISTQKGYFEERFIGKKTSLYIKHKKFKTEFIKEQKKISEFENDNEYLIVFNSEKNIISSKKDVIKIFKQFKKEIKKFYDENNSLFKSNEDFFYEKLLKFIDEKLKNVSNE